MTSAMEATLAIVLAATLDVQAGGDLADALARARPGDTIRLGAGEHRGTLGRLAGVRVEGTGAGETLVSAPEGEDGALVTGPGVVIAGLALRAGPGRCGLKVLGGEARLEEVVLSGGSCAAFVEGGRLEGRDLELSGGFGLLLSRGDVVLEGGGARGSEAGIGVIGGHAVLRRFAVVGPGREAGISVARGAVTLEDVVVRAPGPSGIAVSAGGRVEGVAVTIAGATESQGFLGACVQVIRGTVRLEGGALLGCGGAAVEASGGTVTLAGVDASGGAAGCLVFVNDARAELTGNLCAGRGPGLVLGSGARARASVNRWWTDPVLWVDCGSGARAELGRGEEHRQPCGGAP
jgi:hypothetical protein